MKYQGYKSTIFHENFSISSPIYSDQFLLQSSANYSQILEVSLKWPGILDKWYLLCPAQYDIALAPDWVHGRQIKSSCHSHGQLVQFLKVILTKVVTWYASNINKNGSKLFCYSTNPVKVKSWWHLSWRFFHAVNFYAINKKNNTFICYLFKTGKKKEI